MGGRDKAARVFLFLYKFWSVFQRSLIFTTWGFIAECKHKPSCSENMANEIRKDGLKGVFSGFKQLLSCH